MTEDVFVAVVKVGQEQKRQDQLVKIALATYVGEPCRVCGRPITWQDMDQGAVFAGYSEDGLSRSAHKECWQARKEDEDEHNARTS